MIEQILELLAKDDWYGVSENIDIAKGKYKIPKGYKEKQEQTKRERAWRLLNK